MATSKKSPVAYIPPAVRAGANTAASAGGSTSGGGTSGGSGGYKKLTNPWASEFEKVYGRSAAASPYAGDMQQGIGQARALAGKDYEGAMRNMAHEDVTRQITSADNQLGAMGMRELALRPDVQKDRADLYSRASTQAAIDAQGMQQSAMTTLMNMINSASADDLNRISAELSAARAGASNYLQFEEFAVPLQEKAAAAASAKTAALNTSGPDPYAASRAARAAQAEAMRPYTARRK